MSFTFAATRGPVLRLRLRLQLRLLGADFQVPTTPRKAVRKGHETKSTSAGPQQSKKHNMLRHFSRRWSGKMSSPLAALAPPRRFGPAAKRCLLATRPAESLRIITGLWLANWAGYGWDTAGSVEDMLRPLAGLCTTSTVGHHLTEGLTETNKTGFRNVSEVLSCKG